MIRIERAKDYDVVPRACGKYVYIGKEQEQETKKRKAGRQAGRSRWGSTQKAAWVSDFRKQPLETLTFPRGPWPPLLYCLGDRYSGVDIATIAVPIIYTILVHSCFLFSATGNERQNMGPYGEREAMQPRSREPNHPKKRWGKHTLDAVLSTRERNTNRERKSKKSCMRSLVYRATEKYQTLRSCWSSMETCR